MRALILAVLVSILLPAVALAGAPPAPAHGIAMHGDLKYPSGFKQFDYVNPDAPKGGEVRLAAIGTFDSFNPFIVRGQPAGSVGLTFDTLMAASADEPFSEYGLIAESIETPPDRSWVIFNLRPQARFHDSSPVTADDVLFSFDILKSKGSPHYRAYYMAVTKAEKLGEHRVRFTFAPGDNRELPLILGQLPVLSKAYWQHHAFDQTTLEPPLGSGPYRIESFEAGRYVRLVRVRDYWGKDLPVNKGQYNFDAIRTDYYRDTTVALEAFKAGNYDYRPENESRKWATQYDFPAVKDGRVKKIEVPHKRPTGMQAFVYNLRRPLFQDDKVRQALAYAFDFEWTNRNLFYGQYTRTQSYFSNSDLASSGLPSAAELKALDPLKDRVPPRVFTETYKAPATDGTEMGERKNLRIAAHLLREAGWQVKNNRLVKDGKPFTFEILLEEPIWERICLPFAQNLARLGIVANIRTVDTAQYKNRVDNFDFDMVVNVWPESESPGNEQRDFWGSAAAEQAGSGNLGGIQNPAVDALVDQLVSAPDRESLVTRVKALDRVLLWNHYVIPHWHLTYDRIAYWNKFGMPTVVPKQGAQFFAWWWTGGRAAPSRAKAKGH